MIGILSLVGTLYTVGIDSTKIAELRSGNTVAWMPPPAPTVVQDGSLVEPGRLPIDADASLDVVRRNITSSLVNVRTSPGYLGKPADDVLGQVSPGEEVEVLDGPQTANGLNWWYVRLSSQTEPVEGWIAEATASGVQILGE